MKNGVVHATHISRNLRLVNVTEFVFHVRSFFCPLGIEAVTPKCLVVSFVESQCSISASSRIFGSVASDLYQKSPSELE